MRAYRLLTGPDDPGFCRKVTAALEAGWELYGNPVYAFDATRGTLMCGQAVIKDVPGAYDPETPLREL